MRSPTLLETTLLQLLSNKDLGNTGFVTVRELASALIQLEQGTAVSYSPAPVHLTMLVVEHVLYSSLCVDLATV